MTSAERVMEYADLPPEAPLESDEKHKPPPDWPQYGVIIAQDVCLQYSEEGPVVLKHLNFCIRSQEKVGYCSVEKCLATLGTKQTKSNY